MQHYTEIRIIFFTMFGHDFIFNIQKRGSKLRNRFFMTLGLGLFSLFGSNRAIIGGSNLAGSGALGVLVMAFMASQGWDSEEKVSFKGIGSLRFV